MSSLDRRRFLKLGAAATAVALGGCLGSDDETAYVDWIPPSTDGIHIAYADLTITEESEKANQLLPVMFPSARQSDETTYRPNISGLEEIDDLCLTTPLEIGGGMMGAAVLTIAISGLGYLVDPEQPEQQIDELVVADGTIIGLGNIDTQRADEQITSGTDEGLGPVPSERIGEYGEFTMYETRTDEEQKVTAIDEETLIVADTREEIQTVIETERGDHERATGQMDTFEWLTETAGTGHFVAGWVSPVNLTEFYFGDIEQRPGADLITQQDDFCASVAFSVEDSEITSELALQDPDLDSEKRDQLDARLGTASDESEIDWGEQRVSVTSTYSTDVLDIEFTEPGDDGSGSVGDGETPPAVEEAVPENAFEFSYDEEQGRVRVEFVESFEAERVTIRSVEAGGEFSSPDPAAINFAYVYADPDGDEIVVSVTVDGKSGPVARTEIP